MEVGRARGQGRAVVVRSHPCRDVEGPAQRDHEVGEIAADADALDQRVDREVLELLVFRGEVDMLLDPVLDREHPAVPGRGRRTRRKASFRTRSTGSSGSG
jgi:hypothetical protein